MTCKQSGYSDTTISIAVSVPSELSWPVDFTVNPTSMVISNSSKSTTLTVKMPDLATMICESSDTELFTVAKQGTNVINIIGNSTRKTGTAEVKITVSKSGYTTSTTIVHVTISEPLNGRVEFSFAPTSISLTNANKTATVTVTVPEGAGWDIVSNDTSLFSVSKLSDTTFEIEGNHQLKTGNASFTINTWLSGYSVNSKSGSVVINTPLSWPVDVTADKSNILLNRDLANTTITLDMPTDATYTAVTSEGGG